MPYNPNEVIDHDFDWKKLDEKFYAKEIFGPIFFCTKLNRESDCLAGNICEGCPDPPDRLKKNKDV